jgi:phosphoribosylamine-glycine ligase
VDSRNVLADRDRTWRLRDGPQPEHQGMGAYSRPMLTPPLMPGHGEIIQPRSRARPEWELYTGFLYAGLITLVAGSELLRSVTRPIMRLKAT